MKYTTPTFYKEFKCIGGACEDSCCDNWEIDLDDESLKFYMSQKGEFGKRMKACTKVKEKQFILNGRRCPFHNDDDLCDIYIELGEEALCQTCTNFPRHIEEFDNLKEVSLTMSCPEASRIMLAKKEKMAFECKDGTDREYGLKELKPVSRFAFWKKGHENKLNKPLFEKLIVSRELVYDILQDRRLPVMERALKVLVYADELQKCIDDDNYDAIDSLTNKYKDNKKTKITTEDKKTVEINNMLSIINMYEGLENIIPDWKGILQLGFDHLKSDNYMQDVKEFLDYYKDKEYEFEHILVYYIFNYFLGASYDNDPLTKVKFAIISYLVIFELDVARWAANGKTFDYEDQVVVAHAYSKEVEHSYDNYESLQLVLSAHPILTVDNICSILECYIRQ
ncbi:MAG: hypothetical protein E7271_02220 [Lachnospiraceae bacterium]|nr:hypothetical protein [Lachnospiraceae bacterium]